MSVEKASPITKLLRDWQGGDAAAFGEVASLVDRELHRLAAHYMSRERRSHTLQATALVNEAYIRLIGQNEPADWESRSHFIGIAAQHMRQILVDHARRQLAGKRGGGAVAVPLDGVAVGARDRSDELIALHEALEKLEKVDARKGRAIELKYFGGLEMAEIATVLGISVKTVEKDARVANAWLRAILSTRAA